MEKNLLASSDNKILDIPLFIENESTYIHEFHKQIINISFSSQQIKKSFKILSNIENEDYINNIYPKDILVTYKLAKKLSLGCYFTLLENILVTKISNLENDSGDDYYENDGVVLELFGNILKYPNEYFYIDLINEAINMFEYSIDLLPDNIKIMLFLYKYNYYNLLKIFAKCYHQ